MATKQGITVSVGNTKVGKVHNISLPPCVSCMKGVACAKDCYAAKAWRQYPAVRDAWQGNWDFWKQDPMGYMESIANYCVTNKVQRFRWHVAGDITNDKYFTGMCTIAKCLGGATQFLAFTKNMHTANVSRPNNLTMVASMWPHDLDRYAKSSHAKDDIIERIKTKSALAWVNPTTTSTDLWYNNKLDNEVKVESLECSGKCDTCFLCWHLDPGASVVFNEH